MYDELMPAFTTPKFGRLWTGLWHRYIQDRGSQRSVEAGWRRYAFATTMLRRGQVGNEWNEPEVLGLDVASEEIPSTVVNLLRSRGCLAGERVVEIGCGGGRFTNELVKHFDSTLAFDTSRLMLRAAKERVRSDSVKWELGDGMSIPAASRSADCVVSFDCFVHLPIWLWYSYMREAARVLRPNGTLVIHGAALDTPLGWERFEADVRDWGRRRRSYWGSFSQLDETLVRELATRSGMSLEHRWLDVVPRDAVYSLSAPS